MVPLTLLKFPAMYNLPAAGTMSRTMSSAEAENPIEAEPSTGLSDAIRAAGVLPIVVNDPPIYT